MAEFSWHSRASVCTNEPTGKTHSGTAVHRSSQENPPLPSANSKHRDTISRNSLQLLQDNHSMPDEPSQAMSRVFENDNHSQTTHANARAQEDEQILISQHRRIVEFIRDAGMNVTAEYLSQQFPQWRTSFPDVQVLLDRLNQFPAPFRQLQDTSRSTCKSNNSSSSSEEQLKSHMSSSSSINVNNCQSDALEETVPKESRIITRRTLTCKYCWNAPVTAITLPCRHLSVCDSCSDGLKQCKLCNTQVKGLLKVFLS